MKQKIKNNDEIKFDLTKLSNSDRRLCSLILNMFFESKITVKELVYYINLYNLPIIK